MTSKDVELLTIFGKNLKHYDVPKKKIFPTGECEGDLVLHIY